MSQYTRITEQEMDEFLLPKEFKVMNVEGTHEKVYGKRVDRNDHPLSLRIYSTIANGKSRDKGKDAIRVELFKWDRDKGEPVHIGHSKRVHRIETWRKNLQKRLNRIDDMIGPACPSCGKLMTMRSGSNGKFWGCTDYPECSGTRSVK